MSFGRVYLAGGKTVLWMKGLPFGGSRASGGTIVASWVPVRSGWLSAMGLAVGAAVCAGQAPVERRLPGQPDGPIATLKAEARLGEHRGECGR